MVYRGQRLHRLGKAGMKLVSRLLRTMPQLPDTKMSQIVPENTNAEPLPVPSWLCMAVGNIRLCWRSGVDAKILGELFGGILGTDAEQSCGEVDDISAGPAAEAEEIILIQLQTGMLVLVKWATGHAVW